MLHSATPTYKPIQGSVPLDIAFTFNYNTPNIATGVRAFKVQASVAKPVLLTAIVQVVTAFNAATTNVALVGTTPTGGEIDGGSDIAEGTVGFNTPKRFLLTANTIIYVSYTQSGTVATAGKANLFFTLTQFNKIPVVG